jgi:hypothetical protein
MFDIIFKDPPQGTFIEIWQPAISPPRRYIPASTEFIDTGNTEIDTYFGVALRKSRGSEKADVYGTRVLWVDVDNTEFNINQCTYPPSIIVHSGGGWHLYWALTTWCVDQEVIENANKALADDVGGDSCFNVNRFLRVPGTINTKYSGVRAQLRQQRQVAYDICDFKVLAALDGKTRHKVRTGDTRGYGGDRSRRDWAIITSLLNSGASERLIRTLYTFQPCGDKYRDPHTNAEDYIVHTLERAHAKGEAKKTFGITETDTGYFIETAKGRRPLSTFILVPTLLLQGDTDEDKNAEDAIVCDVKAEGHVWMEVKFRRSAFNSRRDIDKTLNALAWVWLGKDDDIRALLPYLLQQLQDKGLPKTRATTVLGRHKEYYVGPTQCISKDTCVDGVQAPYVYLDLGREHPRTRYIPDEGGVDWKTIPQINVPEVIWPIIGWYMACPYKTHFEAENLRFPILNLYGTKGSGKTATLRIMQRLMGYCEPRTWDCTTTRFSMLAILGSSNTTPVSFSEYRASIQQTILRFILMAYDSGHDVRGRADQTTTDYPLIAPFTVDGEDQVADAAAMERIIAVHPSPSTIVEGSEHYHQFLALESQPLEQFALGYIQHTLKTALSPYLIRARELVLKAFPMPLPTRVRNNMIVITVGVLSFCEHTNVLVPDMGVCLDHALRSVWTPEMGRGKVAADEFIEAVVNNAARRRTDFFWKMEGSGILRFQLATAYFWWQRNRRLAGAPVLDREAIKQQLYERDVATGNKGQYIVKPTNVDGMWAFGIDLTKAAESGLDISTNILRANVETFEVT